MIKSKEVLLQEAIWEIEGAEKNAAKFAADFIKDPSYALSWSHDAFKSAAKHKVFSNVKRFCEQPDVTLDMITKEVQSTVLRGAMYPERSTSVQSNVMSQDTLSVWASLLERLTK